MTLSTYAYAGRGNFEPGINTEPSRDDFLGFNLMEDARQLQGVSYQFELDGQRWIAVKISEFALFPLKAGKLRAGEVTFGFAGRGYSTEPKGLVRKAPLIEIEVVEPPLNGRPPGYKLGDVGHFNLDAQVEPREVPAGGSISIVAKLEGVGNLPFTLLVPEQDGAHFLEPQIVDQVAPKRGIVQGFRTFTYVVELTQPGERDLGELTLPYWDPKARAYGVARAALGKVTVTGTAKPAPASAKAAASGARLKSLITPPARLGAMGGAAPSFWPSRVGYWLLLFGVPLTTVLGFALSDLAKLLSKRARERKGSLTSALDDALGQLAKSAQGGRRHWQRRAGRACAVPRDRESHRLEGARRLESRAGSRAGKGRSTWRRRRASRATAGRLRSAALRRRVRRADELRRGSARNLSETGNQQGSRHGGPELMRALAVALGALLLLVLGAAPVRAETPEQAYAPPSPRSPKAPTTKPSTAWSCSPIRAW